METKNPKTEPCDLIRLSVADLQRRAYERLIPSKPNTPFPFETIKDGLRVLTDGLPKYIR